MFADSANYVSSSTVGGLNGIESFFYSNDQDDFSNIYKTLV